MPMSRPRTEPEFVLSALDRLIDRPPDSDFEAEHGLVGPLDRIKESVLTNLSWLLNARQSLI